MYSYLWNSFDPLAVPGRQLHNLRLQPLLRQVTRDRLRYHSGLVICRYPACNAMVWEVSRKVADKRAYKVVVEVLGFGVGTNYVIKA